MAIHQARTLAKRRCVVFFLCFQLLLGFAESRILDFLDDFDSIPFDESKEACRHNSALLTQVLNHNASNNLLRFPVNHTFNFHHGIVADSLNNTVIQIDGTIRFQKVDLPRDHHLHYESYPACLAIQKSKNVTISSQYRGLIDGRGSQYWGVPVIGYLEIEEHRPRLLRFNLTNDLLIENIILQDSPYHTLYLDSVNGVEIRNVSIINRRTYQDGHSLIDMTAFNTDGIDVSGSNVWIHDCDIYVQDDCIAVKDVKNHSRETGIDGPYESSNMVFERINASGLGFTIGAIKNTYVRNITFRDSYLHKTVKGIYMKFAEKTRVKHGAIIEDILYENITMESPSQWPIWIGPAQQADTSDVCHPNPCSLCWPITPGSKCHVVQESKFRNITLRNIRINNPEMSPGVIIGSHEDTIDDILFENVLVTRGLPLPIARMDRHETFPGIRQPIHDEYVPKYVAFVQRKLQAIQDHIGPVVLRLREALEKTRGGYTTAAMNLVQNGGGAEQWYLSIILQEALGAIWMWLILSLFTGILTFCILRHWNRYTTSNQGDSPTRRRLYHSLFALLFLVFLFSTVFCLVVPFRKPKWQRMDHYYKCKGVINGVARGETWPVPRCFKYEQNWTALNDSKNDEEVPPADTSITDGVILLSCLTLVMVMVAYRKINHPQERLSSSAMSREEDRSETTAILSV
eukprot:CAMPEP_0172475036 /NCGR_PEP_ID=MMETSP1065-20121228/69659_1 /TAXON_ID=265537 /ORGANISM="Amphiprora paludosa, Strain CCMP125" /LENGTH=686 /DNA_ID=CAMNT_0013233229 /DNA_START=148 /DNA_END=2208 /DNA_ORIENTATION=+